MNAARAKAGTICVDTSYRGCVSFSTGKAEKGLRNSLTYKLQVHKRETITKLCSFGETRLRDYGPARPCPRGFPARCIFVFHFTRSGTKGAMIWPQQRLARSSLFFAALERVPLQKCPLSRSPSANKPQPPIKPRISLFQPGAAFATTSSHMYTPTQCPAAQTASVTTLWYRYQTGRPSGARIIQAERQRTPIA